jgi:hypothetical protein
MSFCFVVSFCFYHKVRLEAGTARRFLEFRLEAGTARRCNVERTGNYRLVNNFMPH